MTPIVLHGPRKRLRRWLHGHFPSKGEKVAFGLLLLGTAFLYLWGLSVSGWANSYYSAAVQAGSRSWKAFFFGSSDAGNAITVDKSPLALWPMALSVRLFGLNSWSILVPQAIEGVASVALLVVTVKRWFGSAAGLIAGVVMALTPVAVLMFRFNNPDAVLVLLFVAAAYFTTRALEDGRTRWMVLAGVMIGLAFLAKELQAFVIVPVLAGTFLIAGPTTFVRRLRDTVIMGVVTLLAAGWWVLIVELWPASDRPYIGGSQNNTFRNVLFGYNGLGRITGNEQGSVGGLQGFRGAGRWGTTGITRMFNTQFGGQVSWLIPLSLLVVVLGLATTIRRRRTDRARAAILLWGGWLLLTGLVFSLSQGIIHEYYTVALAPAIGALAGIGAAEVWRYRRFPVVGNVIALGTALSSGWAFVLLDRYATWYSWLRWTVLGLGIAISLSLVVFGSILVRHRVALALGLTGVMLAGPTAFSLETMADAIQGARPMAGPEIQRNFGRFLESFGKPGGGGTGGLLNGVVGPFQANEPSGEVIEKLLSDADDFTWVAAAIGSVQASLFQLATERPVMAIGGFNSTDPYPTLDQFQQYVADRRIHFFIATGLVVRGVVVGGIPPGGGMGGAGNPVPFPGRNLGSPNGIQGPPAETSEIVAQQILTWVAYNFEYVTIDGTTYYDLTRPNTNPESP